MTRLTAALFAAASLSALICAAPAIAAEPSDTNYTVLMGKGPSGAMELKVDADGTRHVTYSYVDRGRGPATTTDTHFDAKGNVVVIDITGVDYLKAKVDEHLAIADGKLTWRSAADDGVVPARADAVYTQYQSNSEDLAILARQLLASPSHELDLVPGGHARIEATSTEYTGCRSAAPCGGDVRPLRLYLITGVVFDPAPIWLDSNLELGFEGSSWISSARKGEEAIAPKLIALQSQVIAARSAEEAKALQRRPDHAVVFTHAVLFDAETGALIPHTTVVVDGNKIAAVGRDGAVRTPAGAEVIDAHGQTLMPGLTDMHVHLSSTTDGRLDLLNGVTTVRDMGNDMDELLAWRRQFISGEQIGPRVWLACLVDGRGPFAGPTKMLISTPDEAHAAVKLCADDGYEQMKIYSSVDPKLVPVIIVDAHARGLRVSGHIPAGMTMEEGVAEGYDEVQHANFWFLNFMGPEVTAKTNTIVRLKAPAEHARDLDLSSPEVARFIALLQAHHTAVDPTLVAFEDEYTGDPKQPGAALGPVTSRLPPAIARTAKGGGLGAVGETRKQYAESFERFLQMTKKLHDAGIRIEPGTDGLAGFPLAHELEDYVRAGIPANQVLQMATLGDAQVMHHDKDQGSIAPGKFADLILIDGDPVADIAKVRRVSFVMKDGVIYDLAAIAKSVGVMPVDIH